MFHSQQVEQHHPFDAGSRIAALPHTFTPLEGRNAQPSAKRSLEHLVSSSLQPPHQPLDHRAPVIRARHSWRGYALQRPAENFPVPLR